jgi:hypothetical protein
MFSLLPDEGAAKRIGATFSRMARTNLERRYEKRYVMFGFESIIYVEWRHAFRDAGTAKIDIVRDVIEATCTRWVCEAMVSASNIDTVIVFLTRWLSATWGSRTKTCAERRRSNRKGPSKWHNNVRLRRNETLLHSTRKTYVTCDLRVRVEDHIPVDRYVFRSEEPEMGWSVREIALNASQGLREYLTSQLRTVMKKTYEARILFTFKTES